MMVASAEVVLMTFLLGWRGVNESLSVFRATRF
ncbi:Uncharacterised protein [Vibrio cholerae]|nr:Uncharacterised protein [Vibrio cholerae]CSI38062.1 Uncharacterised protein [Vibrio cholerae]CSI73836.1 Uncharacterised protein [Vibrio cholerae]